MTTVTLETERYLSGMELGTRIAVYTLDGRYLAVSRIAVDSGLRDYAIVAFSFDGTEWHEVATTDTYRLPVVPGACEHALSFTSKYNVKYNCQFSGDSVKIERLGTFRRLYTWSGRPFITFHFLPRQGEIVYIGKFSDGRILVVTRDIVDSHLDKDFYWIYIGRTLSKLSYQGHVYDIPGTLIIRSAVHHYYFTINQGGGHACLAYGGRQNMNIITVYNTDSKTWVDSQLLTRLDHRKFRISKEENGQLELSEI